MSEAVTDDGKAVTGENQSNVRSIHASIQRNAYVHSSILRLQLLLIMQRILFYVFNVPTDLLFGF